MDGRAVGIHRLTRRDVGLVALQLLLAGGIHGWLIVHTTVPARDGIGFIRYAWELGRRPWRQVLHDNAHPPLYPLCVLAGSVMTRPWIATDEPTTMQRAAQLASGFAGTLLVVPMFLLGRQLFNRNVAFGATAFFQCLPGPARITSDALSEALFLLLVVSAVCWAAPGVAGPSAWRLVLCGISGGLAYLTRPEGMLVIAAVTVLLLWDQIVVGRRRPWPGAAARALAMLGAAAVVALPYIAITGRLTNKPTGRQFLEGVPAEKLTPGSAGDSALLPREVPSESAVAPLLASTLAVLWQEPGHGPMARILNVGRVVAAEWIRGLHTVAAAAALAGLWWFRARWRTSAAARVLLLTCACHLLAVCAVAWTRAYVSERHVLVLVLGASYWAVAALAELGKRMARHLPRVFAVRPGIVGTGLVAIVTGLGLLDTLKPMHTNRAGHRLAGCWLAGQLRSGDRVLDPLCWAGYYAGRVLSEPESPGVSGGRLFIVLERSGNQHPLFIKALAEANQLAEHRFPIYRCPLDAGKARDAEVVVYRVPQAPPGVAGN